MSANTIMFPGSGDVFVRYHDIIGTPRFNVLVNMIRGHLVPGLYDLSYFRYMSVHRAIDWYVNRNTENFLDTKFININHFSEEENEKMLQQLLAKLPSYISFAPVDLLSAFTMHPIAERLHIYTKYTENAVDDAVAQYSRVIRRVTVEHGEFSDIIKGIKDECTLITNSTKEAKMFLQTEYKHRYVYLIYPNQYDDIRKISDIYSIYANNIGVIDIRNRLHIWEDLL